MDDSADYLMALHDAHQQLESGTDRAAVNEATERLRSIAPDHRLLHLLDAKLRGLGSAARPITVAPPYRSRVGS